jgi:hypothetical protein
MKRVWSMIRSVATATWASVVVVVSLPAVILLLWVAGAFDPDPVILPTISHPAPQVTTIQVPVPVITERIVTQYVSVPDRATATALLEENRRLKVTVEQLSIAAAQYTTRGTVTKVPDPEPSSEPTTYRFRDWRLSLEGRGDVATYTLAQRFSVVSTEGVSKDGIPTNLIRVYEVGPNEERWPVTIASTHTIATTPAPEGWYVRPTVQGGWGVMSQGGTQGMVVAIPWWKHGRSKTVEHTRWSFLTPAAIIGKTDQSLGVLPVSFNVGTLPHLPVSDIWISPYVGIDRKNTRIIGGTLTVTF